MLEYEIWAESEERLILITKKAQKELEKWFKKTFRNEGERQAVEAALREDGHKIASQQTRYLPITLYEQMKGLEKDGKGSNIAIFEQKQREPLLRLYGGIMTGLILNHLEKEIFVISLISDDKNQKGQRRDKTTAAQRLGEWRNV